GAPWDYPGYPGYQPPPFAPTRTEPFAIVSLVAALAAGFFCFVGPIIAIVFGHIARSRIKRTGADGSGLALAGVIIGYVEVALGVTAIAVLIAIAATSRGDATASARSLGRQVRFVAERRGTSPQDGDVVRTAIREAGLTDEIVLVGSTREYAIDATTEDLRYQDWRLEVHHGAFGQACLYLPPSTAAATRVTKGACPAL
ncbi:MAG: hypothetical protein QOH10_977, partial [Actinomycetota bacterium]|nr:hypothetical protein [Actinomycetota bacterium]